MRVATILKGLGVVVVAAIIGGIAVLMSLDVNQYKGDITAAVEKATGRKLDIKGDISLSVGLSPAVVVGDVSFANAPWAGAQAMVSAQRLEARIDLLSALTGTIRVERLVAIKPNILLEKKDGRVNWALSAPKKSSETTRSLPDEQERGRTDAQTGVAAPQEGGRALSLPDLRAVEIRDAHVVYRDLDAGSEQRVAISDFTAAAVDGPLAITVKGAYDRVPFDLSGTIGALSTLGVAPYPVAVKGTLADIDLSVDGTLDDSVSGLDMVLAIDAPSLGGLKPLVANLPQSPPISLKTRVKGEGTAWQANGIALSVGRSTVTGDVSVDLSGARPSVDVVAQAALVDLREVPSTVQAQKKKGEGDASSDRASHPPPRDPPPRDKVFPSDPLPLDALKKVDVTADLDVAKVVLRNGIEIEGIGIKSTLNNGKMTVSPLSARVGGGTVSASGTVDGSSAKTLAMDMTLRADKVILGTLFEEIKRPNLLSGSPTEATIAMRGSGKSLAALIGSLSGTALVKIGKGKIHSALLDWAGADLLNQIAETVLPFTESSPYTELTCGVVNLTSTSGVITWDRKIALQTSKMNVVSSGSTNLATETLDVAVRPYARSGVGISAGRLAEMIRLRGSYAHPKVGIDVGGVVRNVGSIIGAVATGGGSLLAETLIDSGTTEPDPCKVALDEKKPVQGPRRQGPTPR